jgi:flotillin
MVTLLVALAVGAVVFVGIFIMLLRRYKRCPANKMLVISGKVGSDTGGNRRSAKCIHGGAAFVWPVIQQYEYMSLEPMGIDITLKSALTKQNLRVNIPAYFTVAVSNRPGVMENAAERLLGLESDHIRAQAEEIIFGQLRLVVAMMEVEQIVSDRETFIKQVTDNVASELEKIGLDLINVNTKDVTDEAGYIAAKGKEAASNAINRAKVQVAQRDQEGAIGEADAERERRIKVAEAQAAAQQGENLAKATVAGSEAELRTKQAMAGQTAQVAENNAAREVATARAERERAERMAIEVVPAEVEKLRVQIAAEAKAEQTRRHAQGEADATLAKLTAEANGLYLKLSKTAEGLKLIVDAAKGDPKAAAMLMIVDQLPAIIAEQVKAISGLKIDKITVWDSGGSNGHGTGNATADFAKGLLAALPPIKEMLNMAGMELPGFLDGQSNHAASTREVVRTPTE